MYWFQWPKFIWESSWLFFKVMRIFYVGNFDSFSWRWIFKDRSDNSSWTLSSKSFRKWLYFGVKRKFYHSLILLSVWEYSSIIRQEFLSLKILSRNIFAIPSKTLQNHMTETYLRASLINFRCYEIILHSCPNRELSKIFSYPVYLSTSCGK